MGPPRQAIICALWLPGDLRQIFIAKKMGDCACKRELAANGLVNLEQRFENPVILGQGGYGAVHRVTCKTTGRKYAIKKAKEVRCAGCKKWTVQCLMEVGFL